MKQYLELMKCILDEGVWKEPSRPGMPRTKELFGCMMKFNLQEGFPLLTTKKMFTKGIVGELLWFLRGDTNITALVSQGINIWNKDAYRYYCEKCIKCSKEPISYDEFIDKIKTQSILSARHLYEHPFPKDFPQYVYGDCGQIYGYQWRRWMGYIDQVKCVIENIKSNPDSRYHIITAWQPSCFLPGVDELLRGQAALPACHMLMQFSVRERKYLDLSLTQRSADFVLGVPFNIASYALLCHIFAAECNLQPGVFTWFGNSVHIYENQIEVAQEQLERKPYPLCELEFTKKDNMFTYDIDDFKFVGYQSHPALKAPLSVGNPTI